MERTPYNGRRREALQPAYHTTATVLEGGRLEIEAPELTPGQCVEVFVVSPKRAETNGQTASVSPRPADGEGYVSVLDFIETLPPGPRSAPTWEEVERNFQEERDAWDR